MIDFDDLPDIPPLPEHSHHPGLVAFTALVLSLCLAIGGAAGIQQKNRDASRAAAEANCRAHSTSRQVLVNLLNIQTAPIMLGSDATPEQVAEQERRNAEAAEYRRQELAKLKANNCAELGEGDVEPVKVKTPPLPEPGAPGLSGETGPAGLNGTPGIAGKDGVDGIDGKDGRDGKDGADSTVPGPKGDKGDPGEPAPTTTTTEPPPTTTTTQPPPTTTTTTTQPPTEIP